MATDKPFSVVESEGDLFLSDVTLNAGQRAICGRCQNAQLALAQKEEELASFLDQIKSAQEEVDKWKKKVYEVMDQTGAKKIESNLLVITKVDPSKRIGIDAKKLEALNPKLYQKAFELAPKITEVSGYAKIKVKNKPAPKMVEGEIVE